MASLIDLNQIHPKCMGEVECRHNITEYSLPTMLQFHYCTFENNTATMSHYDHLYTDIQGKGRVGYGS